MVLVSLHSCVAVGVSFAMCGAVVHFRPIAVCASYQDRGMSNESHDAVVVVITLRGASQPAERKKRKCLLACTRVVLLSLHSCVAVIVSFGESGIWFGEKTI